MKLRIVPIVCLCAATFCFASAQADTLLVTQDAYANGINPDVNYGSGVLLNIRDYGPTNSFIEFDVSSLSGSMVETAILLIDVVTVKSGGTVDVRLVNNAWSENTLTFNNQPGFGGPQANIPIASGDAGGTVSVDVTAIVQGWANGAIANYGLALTPSSINVRLGSKEGNAPARLDVSTSGIPTRTSVNVPEDFDTIQSAIDKISVTWCPAEALHCVISIDPGVFGGFTFWLYESPQPQTVAIVGAGESATVIGSVRTRPDVLNANTILEIRNLTVEEDGVFPDAIYSTETGSVLIEDVVVSGTIKGWGSEYIFTNITLSDVKAEKIEVQLNSHFEVIGSDIGFATVDEDHIRASYSSFEDLFIDAGSSANITFCSANNMRVNGSSAVIVNSSIRQLGVGSARVDIGNSIVDQLVDEGGSNLLKCEFVVNENFDAYQSDCTLPAP